jgi:hypothetical protein
LSIAHRNRTYFEGKDSNVTLVIDCHGHYTTAPEAHTAWRDAQKAAFKAGEAAPAYPSISDDEIRETIEKNQLRLIKERKADHTIFSPAPAPWHIMWVTSRSAKAGRSIATI